MRLLFRYSFIAIALLAVLTGGCATSSQKARGSIDVFLQQNDTVQIGDTTVALDKLPRTLKAMGAGPDTLIQVSIPAGAPMAAVAHITSVLRSAGYGRVIFTRPRAAGAFPMAPKR